MMNNGIAHIYTMLVHVIGTDKYVYEKTENSDNPLSLPSFCLTRGSVPENILGVFAAFNINVMIDNYRTVSIFPNLRPDMSLSPQIYQTLVVDLSKYNDLYDFEKNHGFGFKLCSWDKLFNMKDKLIKGDPVVQLNELFDFERTRRRDILSVVR